MLKSLFLGLIGTERVIVLCYDKEIALPERKLSHPNQLILKNRCSLRMDKNWSTNSNNFVIFVGPSGPEIDHQEEAILDNKFSLKKD